MKDDHPIELRIVAPDDWLLWRQLRLEALRGAPDAFSSTLAYWQGEGDTEQHWRNRLKSVELNVIAHVDGIPAGMASGHRRQDDVELISMWVSPFARGLSSLIENSLNLIYTHYYGEIG